jgi:hypothetical protein
VEGLIRAATHKSKREIQMLLAQRFPQADVPTEIRALSSAPATPMQPTEVPCLTTPEQLAPGQVAPATASHDDAYVPATPDPHPVHARITPLSPKRFSFQFTLTESGEDDLRALQGLLAHRIPNRDAGEVTEAAYKIARAVLEKRKFAATDRPRKTRKPSKEGSRYIPAHVRNAVWERDGGRCAFVSPDGKRCDDRGQLEFDHVQEFARGGEATIANIKLLCRAHNQHAAECTYGAQFMQEKRERSAG